MGYRTGLLFEVLQPKARRSRGHSTTQLLDVECGNVLRGIDGHIALVAVLTGTSGRMLDGETTNSASYRRVKQESPDGDDPTIGGRRFLP